MRAPAPHPSPLRGRYLVRNRPWNVYLHAADRLLGLLARTEAAQPVTPPRRILLAVGGHLGDAIIATSAIALARRAFPEAEIGMLVGSWARAGVEGHPDVRWIHTVDQWKMNRSAASLTAKWIHDRRSRREALREIRAVGYDAAVDLYVYYPNVAPLLWRAGIPVRIGYTSGGHGSLYTHPVEWADGDRHASEDHAALLRVLSPDLADVETPAYEVPPISDAARQRAEAALREEGVSVGEYVVMHMTAGAPLREWPREKWRQLAERLTAEGHQLVFTGSGAAQERAAADVARGLAGCVNLSGRLGWHEFIHVIARAQLVVSVETVAAHIAAAVGTPCVALWTGVTRLTHWRPLGPRSTVLVNPVPCAPCFRGRGCAAMSCVRDVPVEAVVEAVRERVEGGGLRVE